MRASPRNQPDERVGPRADAAVGPLVSVIVPVLDEETMLRDSLDRLAALEGRLEVIVVDGGSRDQSVAIARAHLWVTRVLTSPPAPPGRAAQVNSAARLAGGEVVLVLHADTRLPADAWASIAASIADPAVVGGNFALRFDGDDRFARVLTRLYAALRNLGIYYGDSAVFVRRETFDLLGGFRPLPVMDDYDFVRRLERLGRTVCLDGPAITSSRRWRRTGPARTLARWLLIQGLFMAGVPASRLAGLYRPTR